MSGESTRCGQLTRHLKSDMRQPDRFVADTSGTVLDGLALVRGRGDGSLPMPTVILPILANQDMSTTPWS